MSVYGRCRVIAVGPANDGNVMIRLKDAPVNSNILAGNWYWFQANPNMKKEILATALTAISAELNVAVELDKVDPVESGDTAGTLLTIYVDRG